MNIPIKLDISFQSHKSDKKRSIWRIFWLAFFPVFIMIFLQKLGLQLPRIFNSQTIVNSQTIIKTNTIQKIIPKLNLYPINYKLQNTHSIMADSYASAPYEDLTSYAVIDFDSGQVLVQKNLSQKIPIASLTKLMTATVALDLAKPDDLFTASYYASSMQPTKIGVIPGEKISLSNLLNGSLMTSANDAAEVIKEGINNKYQDDIFVKAMNQKSQMLYLYNTNFTNPQGFDNPDNYSTVSDLALLTHYSLTNYPLIRDIVKKDYQYVSREDKNRWFDLYNWNGLLGVYPNVMGVKIGNTNGAKYTTIVLSEREGKKILVVALGAPGILERDMWASQLLDLGFEKAAGLPPINVTEEQLRAKYSTWSYRG